MEVEAEEDGMFTESQLNLKQMFMVPFNASKLEFSK